MSKNIKIVPAILTDDPASFSVMIKQSRQFTSWVQVDLMDGSFVPSSSVTLQYLIESRPDIGWEAHIMVAEPENWLEGIWQAGAGRAIFHYESTSDHSRVIKGCRQLGLDAGIALNPETPPAVLSEFIHILDCVLIMAVNPGFYGAPFIPEVLGKLATIRKLKPCIEVGIDGGIKENNIKEVAACGFDFICVGSAIFRSPSPEASYNRLAAKANS